MKKKIVEELLNNPNNKTWDTLSEADEEVLLSTLFTAQEKKRLNQLRNNAQEKPALRSVYKRPVWLYAAAASVLLLVSIGIWFTQRPPQYLRLTEDYLADIEPMSSKKMGAETIDSREIAAKQAYEHRDFAETIKQYTSMMAEGKENPEQHYYVALSYLQLPSPDYTAAIPHLLIARQLQSNWKELEINWYLGLAYIKTKQLERARVELSKNIGKYRTAETQLLLDVLPLK